MNDINTILPDIKLKFNIDHPSIEECYAFGYECAQAELSEEENPYKGGTLESETWIEGWWAGFYGEEPIHKMDEIITNFATTETISNAANEAEYQDEKVSFLTRLMEITSILAASALVGYQVIDLVA
jgi:hypothetical protein